MLLFASLSWRRPEWRIFALLLIVETLPSANFLPLTEAGRPLLRYPLYLLFCAPLLPRVWRAGILAQGCFRLYAIYFLWALFSAAYSLVPMFSLGRAVSSSLLVVDPGRVTPLSNVTGPLAFAGFGSLFVLSYHALSKSSGPGESKALRDALVLPVFSFIAGISMEGVNGLFHKTWDLYLYAFDARLGLKPTRARNTFPPWSVNASSSPKLLITVATSVLSWSCPDFNESTPAIARISSPSTSSPFSSQSRARSASPSCVIPSCAPDSLVNRWISAGYVLPQRALMFVPFGSSCATVNFAPSSRRMHGVDL